MGQWEKQSSIRRLGCTPQPLRTWVRKTEPGMVAAAEEHPRLKQLERENAELRRANEILRKAYFDQATPPNSRK